MQLYVWVKTDRSLGAMKIRPSVGALGLAVLDRSTMSIYDTTTENDSVAQSPAVVEIVAFRTGDGEMTVIAQAANPFETEDAFGAASDIEEQDVHETVAKLVDPEKLEGQRFGHVNAQVLARLVVDREIEKATFNGALLADDADPHQFNVETEVAG